MAAEQRLSERVPVDIPATVQWQNGAVAEGRIKDVNIRGLAIQLEGHRLPPGALPHVQINLDGRTWNLPALVVHQHDDKCGVMILSLEQSLYLYGTMLQQLH